ncbi:Hemicentin-1 [Nymphon striatum]|nr:Hemicentin-1 [Nymphon striatum]
MLFFLSSFLSRKQLYGFAETKASRWLSETELKSPVVPSAPVVSVNDVKVQDKSIVGPLLEGTEQKFKCQSLGGKPHPEIKWTRDDKLMLSQPTWDMGPDRTINASNELTMTVARGHIGSELTCNVKHNYTNTEYTFSFRIDVNVAPLWLKLESNYDQTNFVEDDPVEFLCRVTGAKPAAQITWYNGTERMRIQPSSNVTTIPSDGTYATDSTLKFYASRYDHKNIFSCQATNVAMKQKKQDPMAKSITTKVQYRISKSMSASVIYEFSCVLGSTPVSYIGSTKRQLYRRVAEHADTPTVIIKPIEGVSINETDEVTLFCTFESNPEGSLQVQWYVNGEKLISDNSGRPEDTPPYLKVNHAQRHDQGTYTCGVRNEIGWGNSSNEIFVTVYHPPDVATRITPDIVKENGVNTRVTLSCVVTAANPEKLLYIRWYKDGIIMNETSGDSGNDIVWTDDIDRTFTGAYSTIKSGSMRSGDLSLADFDTDLWILETNAIAKGERRWGSSSIFEVRFDPQIFVTGVIKVTILTPIRDNHQHYAQLCVFKAICKLCDKQNMKSVTEIPSFEEKHPPGEAFMSASSVIPMKGEDLTLFCMVADLGNPPTEMFRWMKNGTVVSETTEGNITIDYIGINDEGNYSCAAVNSAGMGQPAYYYVKINAVPSFIEDLPATFGSKKTAKSVSLTCTVECDPPCTLHWYINDEDLSDSELYDIKTSFQAEDLERNYFQSVVSTLYWNMTAWPQGMLDEDLVDRSNFSCVSTRNAVGLAVSSQTMFRVEYGPASVEIIPSEVNITENTVPYDVLDCEASAFPHPDFLWKFGDQVVSSERTLVMNYNISRDKAGTYTCIVTNRHGTVQTTATINVQYKPDCSISVSDPNEQGLVNLTCQATANPLHPIHFVWSRDNETMPAASYFDEFSNQYYSLLNVRQGDPEYYGQYECVANNSIGPSVLCSFKITGAIPLLVNETNNNDIILIIIIIVAIIVLVIVIIVCCIVCRRKRKLPEKMGKREGPVGRSEPTPPRPTERLRSANSSEPVYQNVSNASTPKVKPMPRTKNRPLYENVPTPQKKPNEGPFKPEDDQLVYADLYDDIKLGKIPDPRIKPSLPPKQQVVPGPSLPSPSPAVTKKS